MFDLDFLLRSLSDSQYRTARLAWTHSSARSKASASSASLGSKKNSRQKALQNSRRKALPKNSVSFLGVGTDSRQDLQDKVFFALKGPHFDGHDFLNQAFQKGAKAFVVSSQEKSQNLDPSAHRILVPDTLKALTQLAQAWRQKQKLKIIGITGSNGKTSTCRFTQTLLSELSPYSSPKSYNNAIGVSLSILSVPKKEALLIQEIGTSQPGEIAFLTKLCEPFISLVTMVGPSHLLAFKSLSAIAKEKQQIYLTENKNHRVFNKDNPWTLKMWEQLSSPEQNVGQQSWSFSSKQGESDLCFEWLGEAKNPDPSASAPSFYRSLKATIGDWSGQSEVAFSDSQNLSNLMAAATIALAMGLEAPQIASQLKHCRLPEARQQWFYLKEPDWRLCFDAYNANPASMSLFLDSMAKVGAGNKRVLLLGDMRELGDLAESYHKQLAQHKALLEAKAIFFIGEYGELLGQELAQNRFRGFFKSFREYRAGEGLALLKQYLKPGDIIGFKASRGLYLERIFLDLTGIKVFS